MNEIQVFKNCDFGEIRTIENNGKVLFCGKDIATALGYNQPHKAIDRHCKHGTKHTIPHPQSENKKIDMLFITKGDVYRLIVCSKMPNAEKFEEWVFDEVIPSITETGSYSISQKIPHTFAEALRLAASQQEQIENLERTKAYISDKKTATALNTASQKSKEAKRLKIELDRSKEYASIKAVEKLTKKKYNWKMLRNYCTANELEMKKIFDGNYGKVNTYPAEAWMEIYRIDLSEIIK